MSEPRFERLSSFLDDLLHMFEQNPHGLELDSVLVGFFREALTEAVGVAQALELAAWVVDDLPSTKATASPMTAALRRERVLASVTVPGSTVVILPFGQRSKSIRMSSDLDHGGAA